MSLTLMIVVSGVVILLACALLPLFLATPAEAEANEPRGRQVALNNVDEAQIDALVASLQSELTRDRRVAAGKVGGRRLADHSAPNGLQ